MNIHKSQLFWCEQKGYKVLFWHTATSSLHVEAFEVSEWFSDRDCRLQEIAFAYKAPQGKDDTQWNMMNIRETSNIFKSV